MSLKQKAHSKLTTKTTKISWNGDLNAWVEENGRHILPDVKLPFKPLREPKELSLREQKHGLQVIVKLASTELTLQKPEYRGEVWHVEGQMVSVTFFEFSFVNIHLIMAKL